MCRILFVYPNKEGYPIIPLGIAILAGVLRDNGHTVDLFDVTFLVQERLDQKAREKTQVVKEVDTTAYWGVTENEDIVGLFKKKIGEFNPDFIAFSIVENNYSCARELFKIAKAVVNVPIVVGGVFPTVAPDIFLQDASVDIICLGEGEYALLELASRLSNNKDYTDINNLIVKHQGRIFKNGFFPFYNWSPDVLPAWDLFDKRHLFKPFVGKVWKTGFFEFSRGCPSRCAYCANRIYQEIFKRIGLYRREKSVEVLIDEIRVMKERYALELIFFNDENFLLMNQDRFKHFSECYNREISLPFFIQTKAETLLDEKRVELLQEMNCHSIGIGVEVGNEEFRAGILNKSTVNTVYRKAFANCHKFNIRTTAYVMIGLPYETEDNILETAGFCKELRAVSIAISIFAPYHGTHLYDLCVEEGFIKDKYYENISVNYASILDMPQLSRGKIEELYYKFNDLVYG